MMLVQLLSHAVWAADAVSVLTLDQAVEIALANQPTLQMAEAAADMMQAKIQGERSARYPNIKARFVVPFVGTESGVSLYQDIWDFRQTQHRIQASQAQAQASGFEQAVQREDVILNVKVAYYTALIQRLIQTEAQQRVGMLAKRLEQVEGLFNIGRRSRVDVTQARIDLDQGHLQFATAQHDVANARIQLAHAMGLETDLPYDLAPVLADDKRAFDLEHELQNAFAHRFELRHLDAYHDALQAQASAARQSVYPRIFGRLEYRIEGEGASQPGFVVGIGVQGTLFDGFLTAAKAKEANAQVRQSVAQMAVQKQQIAAEVRQAVLRLQLAQEHMQVTQHSQRTAEENLRVMQEQVRLGRASDVELAEAELLATSTNAKYLQSMCDAKIALAQLERATGQEVDK
jgi:outer membrane protein